MKVISLSRLFRKEAKPEQQVEKASTNPYLNARRSWNEHVGGVVASRQSWQVLGILSLLIALAAVGGIVHIGSQSRFIPYVVEVDKLGQAVGVRAADTVQPADPRVIRASVASFISDARLVTPDVALQRAAVLRIYAMLAPNDPATAKMNEWLNGTESSNPFKRAEQEMVNIEIQSVLPQTDSTWQVDWVETVRDRQGVLKGQPFKMRALIGVYVLPPTTSTTEDQLNQNPLRIFINNFSWSKQL
jgi:type IV secretion system protein VirB5